MDTIAVLIPCHNEERTVAKVVTDFRQALPSATIYVYDNCSTDRTAELAASAGAIVRSERKRGKGRVIRRMFREIDALCYLMVDGDDTYPAEAAPEMAKAVLERQADMVVGDRLSSTYFTENKRQFHNFGNSLVRWSINKIFKSDIKDIMTGYRAFSYQFVKTFPVLSKGFEIETEMTIHAVYRDMDMENVVIQYRDRPEGSVSKLNTISDGFKVLSTIFKLFKNYKPFEFCSILAGICFLISILCLVPVLNVYFELGTVPRFPTLIACCFGILTSIMLFISGIILSSTLQVDSQAFEFRLQQVHRWLLAGTSKDDSAQQDNVIP
ncbi:MAG: glycosyltransferase [Desulfovibrio sp.]|nr:glycosyltransferase [Desulfovibrio sp.]